MEEKTIQHSYPAWRDKVNYIIRAKLTGEIAENLNAWEQLWTRKITDNTFELCCIPFFLYDLALGDEVKIDSDHYIKVTKPSGHFTFRVWFGDSKSSTIREEVANQVEKFGCLIESYSYNLWAIDASSEEPAHQITDYLFQQGKSGQLIYETGRSK
jgi:hypothetical protein